MSEQPKKSWALRDLTSKKDVTGGAADSGFGGNVEMPLPKQQSGHSYIAQVKDGFFRSNLFIFLMGQIVAGLVAIIVVSTAWGRFSQQFTESLEWRARTDARMDRMDNAGTNFSHYSLPQEQAQINNNTTRINAIEEQTKKIDVLVEKITRMQRDIDDIKSNVKK